MVKSAEENRKINGKCTSGLLREGCCVEPVA